MQASSPAVLLLFAERFVVDEGIFGREGMVPNNNA